MSHKGHDEYLEHVMEALGPTFDKVFNDWRNIDEELEKQLIEQALQADEDAWNEFVEDTSCQ
jgi:hypothetical protein